MVVAFPLFQRGHVSLIDYVDFINHAQEFEEEIEIDDTDATNCSDGHTGSMFPISLSMSFLTEHIVRSCTD